jgi:hypothetical protein
VDDQAADPAPAVQVELHGDLKTFAVGVFLNGEETVLPGAEPPPDVVGFGQGVGDFRLKASATGRNWRVDVHHALSMVASSGGALLGTSTGVALTAPQLVPLTWEPEVGDGLLVRGRVDRLVLSLTPGPVSVTVGRQPVSFGTGLAFAPLDLVNPFFPATIDSEYKPGVDAARVDVYAGTTGRVSAVAAWAGALPPTDADAEPVDAGDVVLALNGQGTVGVTDLQGFLGLVRGDQVAGVAVASSLGPLGVHGDLTVTNPGPEAVETDPFLRVVVGGEGRPTSTTTIAVEGYAQTLGASDPADYLAELTNPRFTRGEVWLLGQFYTSVSVIQEITPLLTGSASVIANLGDPSALVVPSLSWSLADEATVGVGGYLSLGARRDGPLDLPVSEFGLYPTAVFIRMSGYF